MNENAQDRMLAQWLREGPERGSREALARALAATRSTTQRPGWTFLERWLPMQLTMGRAQAPRFAAPALIVVALAIVVAAAAVVVGSRPRLPAPVGPAANGLIAMSDEQGIYVGRLDGSERRQVSGTMGFAPLIDASPTFSRDGTRIAFLSKTLGVELASRLFVVPVDGSQAAVEVSGDFQVAHGHFPVLAWSPDGRSIAYTSNDHGIKTVVVAAADGSGATTITDRTAVHDLPSWSPDGSLIAYRVIQLDRSSMSLAIARSDGNYDRTLRTVTGPDASLSIAHWSPDGTRLTYYAKETGDGKAWLVDLDGNSTQVWPGAAGGWLDNGIPWSPDGRSLALLTVDDGVVIVDADGTNPHHLGNVANCWIEWSPDGTALYGGGPVLCVQGQWIPLADPGAATYTMLEGAGSWQRVAP